MTKIILVRHGESEANRLGIGYACTSVINSAGRFTVSMAGNLYGIQLADNEKFENQILEYVRGHK